MSGAEQFTAAVPERSGPTDGAADLSGATQALHKFICCLEIGY